MATTLLVFGATGDLARRMLIPSLHALHDEGLLGDLMTELRVRDRIWLATKLRFR